MKKIAAIDIGSNAVRMAIGSLDEDGLLTILRRVRVPLRLGSEAFSKGKFSDSTIKKAVETFVELKAELDHYEVERFEAVATSAYRNASNADVLGKQILSATGIFIRQIDGKEEASLIRKAIQSQIDLNKKNYLLFDIGGGSAELTFLEKGKFCGSISLPVGTVRLLELGKDSLSKGVPAEQAYEQYLNDLSNSIKAFSQKYNPQNRPIRVVGTGGNFRRLSRLRKKILYKKNIRFILPEEVSVIRDILEETPYLKRIKKFGLRPDRADVIIPAIHIMEHVMDIIPVKKIIAPDIGLIHGLLFQVLNESFDKVKEINL
jgi:exopolyphosphatase/guanosine-5'-triphosphate,3'-diphosphate pyrophosphatase